MSCRSILHSRNRTVRLLPGQLYSRSRRVLHGLLARILRIAGRVHLFRVSSGSIVGQRRVLHELSSQLHSRIRRSVRDVRRRIQFSGRCRELFGVPARRDFRGGPAVWRLPDRSIFEPGRGGLPELPGRL